MFTNEISCRTWTRRYSLDETVFERIDTEEKTWLFGFLTADGYLRRHNWEVSVKLKAADLTALEDIRRIFSTDKPIRHTNAAHRTGRSHCCELAINSRRVYEDL